MKPSELDIAGYRDGLKGVDPQFVRWSPRSMSGRGFRGPDYEPGGGARWSPSCFNLQPWRFIYSLKDDGYWTSSLAC